MYLKPETGGLAFTSLPSFLSLHSNQVILISPPNTITRDNVHPTVTGWHKSSTLDWPTVKLSQLFSWLPVWLSPIHFQHWQQGDLSKRANRLRSYTCLKHFSGSVSYRMKSNSPVWYTRPSTIWPLPSSTFITPYPPPPSAAPCICTPFALDLMGMSLLLPLPSCPFIFTSFG